MDLVTATLGGVLDLVTTSSGGVLDIVTATSGGVLDLVTATSDGVISRDLLDPLPGMTLTFNTLVFSFFLENIFLRLNFISQQSWLWR